VFYDFYSITPRFFSSILFSHVFHHRFSNSVIDFLRCVFPELFWIDWKLECEQNDTSQTIALNHFFNYLQTYILSIDTPSSWFYVSLEKVKSIYPQGDAILSKHFHSSIKHFILSQTPEISWNIKIHDIDSFEEISSILECKIPSDWYSVPTLYQIHKQTTFATSITLEHFPTNNPYTFTQRYTPELPWIPWHFDSLPVQFWSTKERREEWWKWVNLNFQPSLQSWYQTKASQIGEWGGRMLLSHIYNHAIWEMVMALEPNHRWQPWRFLSPPHDIWKRKEWRHSFFHSLLIHLGIERREEVYDITSQDIRMYGGSGLLFLYGYSLHHCLCEHFDFLVPWGFQNYNRAIWEEERVRCWYLEWIGGQFGFSCPEEFYDLKRHEVRRKEGRFLLERYFDDQVRNMVMQGMPEMDWKVWLFRDNSFFVCRDGERRKEYLLWLFRDFNVEESDDFLLKYCMNGVTRDEVVEINENWKT